MRLRKAWLISILLAALCFLGGTLALIERVRIVSQLNPRQLSAAQIAAIVGTHYGDPRATVVQAQHTLTEGPPFNPMYLMSIAGRFKEGTSHATRLQFSAVTEHLYVWGIRAYDRGRVVWTDEEWPTSYEQAQQTPLP